MAVTFNYPPFSAALTGGATEAKQDAIIASLSSIDAGIPAALGQATMAASQPVVIASNQSAVPISASSLPLPTGAATETTLSTLSSKIPALGQAAMAASQPVVIANNQTAVPISAASLPLPTGAATETTLAGASAKLPASLGQKAMAASLAVALASDQSAVPTSVADTTASGTITTQNLVPAGAATAGSAVASGNISSAATAMVQVSGTYTGALSLQCTVDGTNWVTVGGVPFFNVNTGALSATIPSAATGIWQIEIAACLQYRITALAAVTGTATVSLRNSIAASLVALDSPLPAGTNIIGALSANQSANVSQINGVTPLMGNGVTGTGSLRVTIASDNTSNTNPFLVRQGGKSVVATVRNDYSAANVTTGAWVQLVASTSAIVTEIDVFDSSGATLELGTGAAASETRLVIITPGGNGKLNVAIPASTRVSVRAISGTASVGELDINFFGV